MGRHSCRGNRDDHFDARGSLCCRIALATSRHQAEGAERAVVDVAHDRLLMRVVVHRMSGDRARVLSGRGLSGGVEQSVLWMCTQPIAEDPMPLSLGALRREHVQVARWIGTTQTAVLIPPGLSNHERKPVLLRPARKPARRGESATVRSISITGLAARSGTDVEPTCSTETAESPSASVISGSRHRCSSASRGVRGHSGDFGAERGRPELFSASAGRSEVAA